MNLDDPDLQYAYDVGYKVGRSAGFWRGAFWALLGTSTFLLSVHLLSRYLAA